MAKRLITIHEAKAGDFTTLGLGALLPSACTVRERAGGMYELKIVHPITDDGRHQRIKPMRIIKAPAPVRETPLVEIGQAGSASRDIYKVATNGMRLNMRAGASMESKIIHAYKPGTEVCRLNSDGDWMQVSILDGGATGWMWADNLEYVRTETETVTGDTPGKVVQPRQTREQLFRIYRYSPGTKERAVTAEARHITYDLAGAVVDGEYSPENVAADQVCAQIMAKADHDVSDFRIYCTVTTPISGEFGGRNILDCLLDPETGIVAQAKARIVRDNYDVFILPDEARNRGVELRYGKNLLSAYMDTDVSNTITRIRPVGKDKNGEKLYIQENGGWVESPYISDYPVIYSKEVEYDVVESDELTIDQARALLREKAEADFLAGCDMATVSLDADFVRLELTEDYKQLANAYALHLYDSVPVIDREADIVATARMTEYVYDAILDEYQDTGLGELEEVKSTVYGYELAPGTVSGGKLIPNTVNGDRLQNSTVSYGKFDLAAIRQLSADAIVAIRADIRKLVAGNITTDQLYADLAVIAAAQITAANIDKANIQWAEIENLAAEIAKVVNAEIDKATIKYAQIEDLDAEVARIADARIKSAKIDTAQINNLSAAVAVIVKTEIELAEIDWAHIKNVEVGTAQIKLGAITQALIAAGAIGTAQIADGSITSAKIVELTADLIKTGTLSAERLLIKGAGGLFYEINAKAGGLTSTQLTEEQYKNAISGTALVARSVTADKMAAKTITANEIMSNTITAAEINVANLFASSAVIAALDSYIIKTGTIEALKGSLDVWADEKVMIGVGGLQIGGRNLLLNTGTLSKANYSFNNSSDASVNVGLGSCAEDEYGGFHIVCNNQNVRIEMGTFPVTPGQTYAMSARYKINSGSAPIQFQYIFRDAANVNLNYWDSAHHGTTTTSIEDGWTVLKSVFTVPDNAEIAIMKLAMRTGADNTAYTCDYNIRRPKFESGNKATDWTPAPEDGDAAIAGLSAELLTQAGKITANATKIETVNQAAAGAQSAADAAQNTANAAQNAANAAQGTANNAVTRVTTAEQSISALDGQVQTKVSQNDFNALGNRVASAESAITVQADKISSKVEKSEFDALGNTVSQMGTEIQQNEEEILLLAGRTVGGTNMLKNTETLRKANYSFNSSGSDAMGSCTEDEHGGFHVVCKDSNLRWQVTELPVTPGQSYVMSVQYKINSGSAPIQFQYVFRDAAGTGLHYWDSVNHSQVGARIEDGWTVMTSVFTVPDNEQVAELRLAVRTGLDYGSYTCDYNIRRPKFEAGSMATAWSPSPDDPAGSVNAGGVVRVDQTGVHMSGGTIEMETSDGDEYIHIKNSGIVASSLEAPNVARRYAGAAALYVNPNATSAQAAAGNYYRSLADACAAVSGRYLEKNVTITVQGATYGDAYLRGVTGYGSVTVAGGNNILYGSLSLLDNTAEIWVNSLRIVRTGTNQVFAGRQYGMGWARWYQCVLDGNGGDQALLSDRGARLMIHETELYNAARLLQVSHNADASCVSLKGGGGTHFFHGDGGRVTWSGTRPDGTLSISNPCLREPYDLAALTIDYGTAQPSAPVVQTAAYNYLYSDSYRSGWQWFSDDDIRQGYDGGVIYGVIWFDAAAIRSALNGKTINQVSLRLYMAKGVGRGVNVNVELYGSNVSYDRTTAPALTTSYGSIGETQPDVVNEITIPAQAVKDMISGTINALVLKSDDAELYKDRGYSKNYARFSGSTTATAENCPRLTVVYQ